MDRSVAIGPEPPICSPYGWVCIATCNGTAGEWAGCRGNGCNVCSELVAVYPRYFINNPGCVPNSNCGGLYYTCNSACPAPTAADL